MTITNHYPVGGYSKKPIEVVGRKYNNKLIIHLELKIKRNGTLLNSNAYYLNFYMYTNEGKVFTSTALSTNVEQVAIDYCKQSKLPYSYE